LRGKRHHLSRRRGSVKKEAAPLVIKLRKNWTATDVDHAGRHLIQSGLVGGLQKKKTLGTVAFPKRFRGNP